MSAAQQAVEALEGQATVAQAGTKNVGKKAMTFAEQNVATSFEFAQKLVRAKDVQEVLRLQGEFVQAQMQALSEQAKELSETASKVAMEAAKPST